MNDKKLDVRAEFFRIIETGSEEEARQFLADHLADFPPELQEKIALASFEEVLKNKADAVGMLKDMKTQGADALSKLLSEKNSLTNTQRQ